MDNPYVFDDAETRRRLNTGELYTDFGPGLEDLEEERNRGKELVERYNATSIRNPEQRAAIAAELFASFGSSWLEAPIYCAYGSHTTIGDHCWFNTPAPPSSTTQRSASATASSSGPTSPWPRPGTPSIPSCG